MGEVLIKCTGSRLEDWKKLKNFQGDLKELSKENYEKLKWRILTKGFKAPFFVWKGHDYLLDGLQRSRALAGLEDDGHTVPARLPVVDIIAETKAEAKDDLLGFVSQYGHPTEEGLYKFLNDVPDLNWDEIVKSVDIPDIDLRQFEEGWIKDIPQGEIKEFDENLDCNTQCPKCGYEWNETKTDSN